MRQGEILANVREYVPTLDAIDGGDLVINVIEHPFLLIVSQDCDLDWDYNANNYLADDASGEQIVDNPRSITSVLCCELHEAGAIRHREGVNSGMWKQIRNNSDERYQFLSTIEVSDGLPHGMPETCIDFKRFVSIRPSILYRQIRNHTCVRRGVLMSPYMEQVCRRYSCYASRIALPEPHLSEPAN